jgi:hypothetical protein
MKLSSRQACAESERRTSSQEQPSLVYACLVPEGEFEPVAETNFVIDLMQIVSDDIHARPDFGSDFVVLESLCGQYDDLSLASSEAQHSKVVLLVVGHSRSYWI